MPVIEVKASRLWFPPTDIARDLYTDRQRAVDDLLDKLPFLLMRAYNTFCTEEINLDSIVLELTGPNHSSCRKMPEVWIIIKMMYAEEHVKHLDNIRAHFLDQLIRWLKENIGRFPGEIPSIDIEFLLIHGSGLSIGRDVEFLYEW